MGGRFDELWCVFVEISCMYTCLPEYYSSEYNKINPDLIQCKLNSLHVINILCETQF
jgi:hypothetical protein